MPLRGLTVNPQGQLLRDGSRFRNIGMNYLGAIARVYSQPSATACAYTPSAEQDAMLDLAASMKVKVIRCPAFAFWPAQWRYGPHAGVAGLAATAGNREAHYAKIDAFVAKCKARDIGVILSLFFRDITVPDLAGQTVRQGWLSAGATRTYAATVTQELLTRYLNEDAVLGYQWSSEVNHYNDASDVTRGNYPQVNGAYGSRTDYTAATDMILSSEYAGIIRWWYDIARAVDPQRILLTGNGPNSYSQPRGVAGISFPMVEWHREQLRDNPTNCGQIHYYGNLPYGSANFRGLDAMLTGIRHWQQQAGRGFVLGEFGNQPWRITAISTAGGVATLTTGAQCPLEVGDPFAVAGTGTALDGQWLRCASINAGGTTVTAVTPITASFSGSVLGLQHMSPERLSRMCSDIINSGTDLALFFTVDGDPLTPVWESISYPGNAPQIPIIRAANEALGW